MNIIYNYRHLQKIWSVKTAFKKNKNDIYTIYKNFKNIQNAISKGIKNILGHQLLKDIKQSILIMTL
jgi:hypothetical protein